MVLILHVLGIQIPNARQVSAKENGLLVSQKTKKKQ